MQQDTHEVGHHDSPWQGGGASAARPASSDFGTGENAAGPGTGKSAGACALILEGGSFRGQFTAGVIDVMLEQGVDLPACYGVSAGALNGLNYKSRQIGRVNRINLAFCDDQRYVGSRALAANGSLIGYDFLLFDVQDRIDPFDNEAYRANPMKLFATVTNIMFGTAEYPEVQDASLDIDVVRATTSLPLVTQPVELNGSLYLDGGVADSVPIEHVLEEEGYDRAMWCSPSIEATTSLRTSSCPQHAPAMPPTPICSMPSPHAMSATTSSASISGLTSARGGLSWLRRLIR